MDSFKEKLRISKHEKGQRFITEGNTNIRGQNIPYQAIAEETMLDAQDGTLAACMFTYTYLRSDVKDRAQRPVIFAYNGGPGSSSIWVHLGFLGPDRPKITSELEVDPRPPFEMEQNPHSPLDICDIVLIDPVDTGFGLLINGEKANEFFGVDQDCETLAILIETWLTKYDRWNSPRFLCGESYGTIRSAVLLSYLMGGTTYGRTRAIPVNGVFLIGSVFQYRGAFEPEYVEPPILHLMTFAATNWYHHPEGKPPLVEFAEKAHQFALTDYAQALLLGNTLSQDKMEDVLRQLEYYTGVSRQFFVEHRLRVTPEEFKVEVCRDEGMEVGRYDSRFKLPLNNQIGAHDNYGDDPGMSLFPNAYAGIFNHHLKNKLKIELDRVFLTSHHATRRWDWKCARTPSQCLSAAMRRNSRLRVFFATGYYDMRTVIGATRYVISQIGLPSDRVVQKEYESGHMTYLGEQNAASMERDFRQFIATCLK